MSAAANLAADEPAPAKNLTAAAISYLCGKIDKAAFLSKCAKNPLYARLVIVGEQNMPDFDSDALCFVHKQLFAPKAESGEIRSHELNTPFGSCADPKLLRGSLKNALAKLNQIEGAPKASKADFAAILCFYVRELTILSPFSYGNGITRRAFIQNFCRARGFNLSYASVRKKELTYAETEAFASDDPQPLFSILVKCLSYITEAETAPAKRGKPHKGAIAKPKNAKPTREIAPRAQNRADNRIPSRQSPLPPPPPQKPRENPQTATAAATAEKSADKSREAKLKELREIQKNLSELTDRVTQIIKSTEHDE